MKNFGLLFLWMGLQGNIFAQQHFKKPQNFQIKQHATAQQLDIYIGKQYFTSFCFPDSLEKPFLFPIHAANGMAITRGFPLNPRPNEPTDHPHHIGLWFNYESVNGLDFWNNSYAIEASQKHKYGWIKTQKILKTKSGKDSQIVYVANWTDQQNKILLQENTELNFSNIGNIRVIERVTKLTALEDVLFKDVKDGMLGLRVAHELELPIIESKKYTDANGNITFINAKKDSTVTGNYLTSAGKQGDAAWGTRASWCMLYGKLGKDSISIVMLDHIKNPGYPTYLHARNYGLFAANPLGQKIFSNGKTEMNFSLLKNQSTIFRYKILIDTDTKKMHISSIEKFAEDFNSVK